MTQNKTMQRPSSTPSSMPFLFGLLLMFLLGMGGAALYLRSSNDARSILLPDPPRPAAAESISAPEPSTPPTAEQTAALGTALRQLGAGASAAAPEYEAPFWTPERLSPLMEMIVGKDKEQAARAILTRSLVQRALSQALHPCLRNMTAATKLEIEGFVSVGAEVVVSDVKLVQVVRGAPLSPSVSACVAGVLAGDKMLPRRPSQDYVEHYQGAETFYIDVFSRED